jgi:prepilin-type processing-associated H-X9-DG protein
MTSSVHYKPHWWNINGEDNAYWNGSQMLFGDGHVKFKPLSAGLDLTGHELTHGVVQYTAGLIYQSQSGALNEAYADILGNLVENKNDAGAWLLGEDIMLPGAGAAVRSYV